MGKPPLGAGRLSLSGVYRAGTRKEVSIEASVPKSKCGETSYLQWGWEFGCTWMGWATYQPSASLVKCRIQMPKYTDSSLYQHGGSLRGIP